MKPVYRSKTIIFNLMLIIAGAFCPGIQESIRVILVLNGLAGLGLRAITTDPIGKK